ncbi:MAG: DegT/DnrJ/EryC1/StrS family aminotransferase [Anaerolineae bacterium]|nr:DegT/DnrJ/EryC1/StrS family aminotransferase [Anaerolineae bacterium]
MMSQLAIDGGQPYRTKPFPARTPFGEEEINLVTEAIRSQNLFGPSGGKVKQLEEEFARLYGVKHAVATTSGTAAIHTAIGAINPNPGDEIITAPITDAGSIVPILYQGCVPVFADVDETYNMDPADVERKITDRTAAILLVHLFGNAARVDVISEIARAHNIPLIEDCSQSHVIKYKGRYLGTWGDIGTFSFQQSKHMTTGDGGMTITNREDLAERMAWFRDKGWTRKPGIRHYVLLGLNYRMTELQGAVGLAQVKKVRSVVERRMRLGHYLTELISDIDGLTPPITTEGSEHGYWLYALRTDAWSATSFALALSREGIGAGAGYTGEPIYLCMEPLSDRRTFGKSSYPFDGVYNQHTVEYVKGLCPRAEDALEHIVTIGINENYTEKDIGDVAGAIRKVAKLLPKG